MKDLESWALAAANGDESATLEILQKFRPLLTKYANKLNYEDAFYDLEIKLLETLKMPFFKKSQITEGQIVSYIHHSIVNEYIRLSKARTLREQRILLYSNMEKNQQHMVDAKNATSDVYQDVENRMLLNHLSPMEQVAVQRIVLNGDSAANVAGEFGCTRQAINQAKQRGLLKLRKIMRNNMGG